MINSSRSLSACQRPLAAIARRLSLQTLNPVTQQCILQVRSLITTRLTVLTLNDKFIFSKPIVIRDDSFTSSIHSVLNTSLLALFGSKSSRSSVGVTRDKTDYSFLKIIFNFVSTTTSKLYIFKREFHIVFPCSSSDAALD